MNEVETLPWDLGAYVAAAKKAGACRDALEALAQYSTMEEAMADERAAEWAYWTALHVPDADVEALQDVVLRSGEAQYAYLFARFVPGADMERLMRLHGELTNNKEVAP